MKNISKDILRRLEDLPEHLVYIAENLLVELESGKKSTDTIENMLREDLRELIVEEFSE